VSSGTRPRILVLLPHFLPGLAYGGPVRTVANLLERMGEEFDFHLLTANHDFRSTVPYEAPADQWLDWRGMARVRYATPAGLRPPSLISLVCDLAPDLLYLNSLFHPPFSLLPMQLWRWGAFGRAGLVLAPRGELAAGALAQKARRKSAFLAVARRLGGYHKVVWQASSEHEAGDILAAWPAARVVVAANLGVAPALRPRQRCKEPGQLRLLFLGRISPIKNLPFLLEQLAHVEGRVELTVAGPAEDRAHLDQCRRLIATLPATVRVTLAGAVDRESADRLLREADLLVQPSLGENFGHAILEALGQGLPVLISDRTPWRRLAERQAGWDLPLEGAAFRRALAIALSWSEEERAAWSAGARQAGRAHVEDPLPLEGHRRLFQTARELRR
jgi:glycosyltransferase involved in cell wall biosynthesis